MQKNKKVAIWAILCIGFLFFVMGGIVLMAGAYFENTNILYVGLGLLLVGVCFYVGLGILFLVVYLKRKKG